MFAIVWAAVALSLPAFGQDAPQDAPLPDQRPFDQHLKLLLDFTTAQRRFRAVSA